MIKRVMFGAIIGGILGLLLGRLWPTVGIGTTWLGAVVRCDRRHSHRNGEGTGRGRIGIDYEAAG
jgi:hypothetical protein